MEVPIGLYKLVGTFDAWYIRIVAAYSPDFGFSFKTRLHRGCITSQFQFARFSSGLTEIGTFARTDVTISADLMAVRRRPMTSEKRIAANRRNAMRSTGPTTRIIGKQRARANSSKHTILTRRASHSRDGAGGLRRFAQRPLQPAFAGFGSSANRVRPHPELLLAPQARNSARNQATSSSASPTERRR